MRGALFALLVFVALAPAGCLHDGDQAKPREGRSDPNVRPLLDNARLSRLSLTHDIPAQVRRVCAEASRAATVRVICPKVIPDAPIRSSGPTVPLDERRFYELDFNTAGPPGRVQHWITGGGQADVVERWVLTDHFNEVKGNAKLVRQADVAGRRVRIYRYPPYPAGGPNGSHWAAFVKVGDELVFASIHGRRHVSTAVAMAVDLAWQAARSPAPEAFPVTIEDFRITYCGTMSVALNGDLWLADPASAGGSASEPYALHESEAGTFVILSRDRAEFRTRSGAITELRRAEPGTPDPWQRCE